MPTNSALRAPGRGSARPAPERGPVNAATFAPDATFPRTVRKSYKAILSTTQETVLLRIPWGPRASFIFIPRGAAGISGGRLRVYAVVEAYSALVSDQPIPNDTDPVSVVVEAGCDTFLVAAVLGTALPSGAPSQPESYVYAATYAGGL